MLLWWLWWGDIVVAIFEIEIRTACHGTKTINGTLGMDMVLALLVLAWRLRNDRLVTNSANGDFAGSRGTQLFGFFCFAGKETVSTLSINVAVVASSMEHAVAVGGRTRHRQPTLRAAQATVGTRHGLGADVALLAVAVCTTFVEERAAISSCALHGRLADAEMAIATVWAAYGVRGTIRMPLVRLRLILLLLLLLLLSRATLITSFGIQIFS